MGVETIRRRAEEKFVAGSETLESKQDASRSLILLSFDVAAVPFLVALHNGRECLNRVSFAGGAIPLLVGVIGEKEKTFCPNLDVSNC
jgi:hypothetical protein